MEAGHRKIKPTPPKIKDGTRIVTNLRTAMKERAYVIAPRA